MKMLEPGQCIEFSVRGLGEIVSAIRDLNKRIDDLESDIAKENGTLETRLVKVEAWQAKRSPVPSAPIIVPAHPTGISDFVRCRRCGHLWPEDDNTSPHPGDPCPECAEKQPPSTDTSVYATSNMLAMHEDWLRMADTAAYTVYWDNKQAKKGGE